MLGGASILEFAATYAWFKPFPWGEKSKRLKHQDSSRQAVFLLLFLIYGPLLPLLFLSSLLCSAKTVTFEPEALNQLTKRLPQAQVTPPPNKLTFIHLSFIQFIA